MVSIKMNSKRPISRHIIIKMARFKDKEKILKVTREKQSVNCKGAPIRPSPDFSTETLKVRRDWHEVFKVMKSKDLQPKPLYPASLSFKIEEKIQEN